jgi:hypothetical protein
LLGNQVRYKMSTSMRFDLHQKWIDIGLEDYLQYLQKQRLKLFYINFSCFLNFTE